MGSFEDLEKELQTIEEEQQRIKQGTMRYQWGLKCQVAADLGVDPEVLDLPFQQWRDVYNAWVRGERKQILASFTDH